MTKQPEVALDLLVRASSELADIHRAKDFSLWRDDAARRLTGALAKVEPFKDYRNVWIYTGDGGCIAATARFGDWAIGRLVEKKTPASILAEFEKEAARNSAEYSDVSPVFGVQIDERCDLEDGVVILPEPAELFEAVLHRAPFQTMELPTHTAMLRQAFSVAPAFQKRTIDESACPDISVTNPSSSQRAAVRSRVRLACLLASNGAVALPLTGLRPDRRALFVAGEGGQMSRPYTVRPLASLPVRAEEVKRAFDDLRAFGEVESLERSIDRLGRSRLAVSPVDRALELGIAAEITLMHGQGDTNTEITHKIGSRAAWLLGRDSNERESIFGDIKKLYQARSMAVHSGVLPSKSAVDLDAADRMVARVLRAILERGRFPDWICLTMGGS